MKTKILLLTLLVFTGLTFVHAQEVKKAKSEAKKLNFGKTEEKTTLLPDLIISDQLFTDANENKIIDANESSEIKFKVSNKGEGDAKNVKVEVKLETKDLKGLLFDNVVEIGDIKANEVKDVSLSITSNIKVVDGTASFNISVLEENGFDAFPFVMNIETHQFDEPYVIIADAAFTTDNRGPAQLNSPVYLTVLVQNVGKGNADNVKVEFEFVNENCVVLGDADYANIGELKSAETSKQDFTFTANKRYAEDKIPIKVSLSESWGTYAKDTILYAMLGENVNAGNEITIEGITDEEGERGAGDPLKGLNVANAKKLMQIGEYFALIIGIDEYEGVWEPLKNAVNDAKAVEDLLKTKYKFDHFITLYNEDATKINIMNELDWLMVNVRESDNVFIFYSGHGEYKDNLDKGFWVPIDARSDSWTVLLSNNDIHTALKGIPSKHTLLVSDACFAGDILRGKTIMIDYDDTEKYYNDVNNKPSRKAITSGDIEPVLDGGGGTHSVFTKYLLKYLEENEQQFYDATELFNDLEIPVINNSRQNPQFKPIIDTGDEGGQFIFIMKQ